MTTLEIIGTGVGIVVAVLGGMWFIINKAIKGGVKEHRLNDVETKTKHANCKSNTQDIDSIKYWIMKLDSNMIDAFAKKTSPRKLTPAGDMIIKLSGADQILPAIGQELISQIEERGPKTAFDVETEAYFAMIRNDSHECYNAIKNFIYNQPEDIELDVAGEKVPVKLNYDAILRATSINLRDTYLNKHPEIK